MKSFAGLGGTDARFTFRLSITVKHNCETALVLGFVLCVVNTAHEEAHDRVETGKGVIITQRRGESVH